MKKRCVCVNLWKSIIIFAPKTAAGTHGKHGGRPQDHEIITF